MAKILLVEDHIDSCVAVTAVLRMEGHVVLMASTADEALAVCEEFDLLIADWMLDGGNDGTDVARAISEKCPDVRVIFVTSHQVDELREKLRLQGFSGCAVVQKPIKIGELTFAIERTLNQA